MIIVLNLTLVDFFYFILFFILSSSEDVKISMGDVLVVVIVHSTIEGSLQHAESPNDWTQWNNTSLNLEFSIWTCFPPRYKYNKKLIKKAKNEKKKISFTSILKSKKICWNYLKIMNFIIFRLWYNGRFDISSSFYPYLFDFFFFQWWYGFQGLLAIFFICEILSLPVMV